MATPRRSFSVPPWAVACTMVLLAFGLAVWVWRAPGSGPAAPVVSAVPVVPAEPPWTAGPGDVEAFADSVASQAGRVLAGLGVPQDAVKVKRLPESRVSKMRWEVRSEVPGDVPLALCNLAFTRLAERLGGEVMEAREDLTGARLSMLVGLSGERTDLVSLHRNPNLARTAGRVAIVIDDFGYQDADLVAGFCALEQPVTLSILPWQPFSSQVAEQAAARGHGVMVHLPMEPIDYPNRDPGEGAIFSDYSVERIRDLTRETLTSIPHVRGMNNHMGSRVTADRRAIGAVLEEVRRYGIFFLDSMTSSRSEAYVVARELGIPCARNTMFLDLEEDEEAVAQALRGLAVRAGQEGTAIGIGHARPATLAALRRVLPELERQGVVFIRAEEAVR